jgi:hypothetical protein
VSCKFISLPADGIKGWVDWIETRVSGCVRIGPADDGPVLGMPTNALGRDLFEKVARMSACDMRDSSH